MTDEYNDNDEGGLGNLGILLIFVGVFLFLDGLVKANAKNISTRIFGILTILGVMVSGVLLLYNHCIDGVRGPEMASLTILFGVLYIIVLIKACVEDRRYWAE
jgi:hypothetical protein